jgi:hypothetical protein
MPPTASRSPWARSCCWGLELPAAGCWELTGHYHGWSLRFVVWVMRWQP